MKGKVGNPAPEGNNYAQKWDLDSAKKLLEDILKYVQKEKNCASLAKASVECGYYENIIDYLKNKFDKQLDFDSIKRAKDIIKSRIIKKGLENQYNATMSIFILKNNHGMNDKVDVTSKGNELKGNQTTITRIVRQYKDASGKDSEDGSSN